MLRLRFVLLTMILATSGWLATAHADHSGDGVAGTRIGNRISANRNQVVCRGYEYGTPDLFYNFYVPPNCGGVGAALYPAPLPVPPHVGHVYYTYQPFMPHEFLYRHHRSYHRYYNEGRGLTRTSVTWW